MNHATKLDRELRNNNLLQREELRKEMMQQTKEAHMQQAAVDECKAKLGHTNRKLLEIERTIWEDLTPQEKVKECLNQYPDIPKMLDVAYQDTKTEVTQEGNSLCITLAGERFLIPRNNFSLSSYKVGRYTTSISPGLIQQLAGKTAKVLSAGGYWTKN